MNHLFVPYQESLELKELGFDEPCFALWFTENKQLVQQMFNDTRAYDKDLFVLAPTFSQAFKWFREKGYDISFRKMDYGDDSVFTGYYYTIYKGNEIIDLHGADKKSKIYEEAELACLRKLIEIAKSKN